MARNVTVQKIISILLHRVKFIILATVVMGLLFFMYSKFIITPRYSTSSMIYVQNYGNTKNGSINEQNDKMYSSDISASSSLASICVTLFKNSDEMTSLYDGCYVNVTVEEDTFFIKFSVDGTDPQKCANVANQLADKADDVFKERFMYGRVGSIRQAQVPSVPYSPSNLKNTFIGIAIGLLASCIISILLELIDSTIKADDDIQEMYGIPVFAEIPDFENQG